MYSKLSSWLTPVASLCTVIIGICIIHKIPCWRYWMKNTCFVSDKDGIFDCVRCNEKKKIKCLVTPWNVSHLVCYFVLAFLFPSYVFVFFSASVIWEVMEIVTGVCDFTDIFYNAIGLLIGYYLSPFQKC